MAQCLYSELRVLLPPKNYRREKNAKNEALEKAVQLARGISIAMNTTAFGLIVAMALCTFSSFAFPIAKRSPFFV
jgi:hypothetical protein